MIERTEVFHNPDKNQFRPSLGFDAEISLFSLETIPNNIQLQINHIRIEDHIARRIDPFNGTNLLEI